MHADLPEWAWLANSRPGLDNGNVVQEGVTWIKVEPYDLGFTE
jgi:hypothetical protein